MGYFDTLIRVDTLIFSQGLGLNRQIMIEEVKIQHVNSYTQPGEGKNNYPLGIIYSIVCSQCLRLQIRVSLPTEGVVSKLTIPATTNPARPNHATW